MGAEGSDPDAETAEDPPEQPPSPASHEHDERIEQLQERIAELEEREQRRVERLEEELSEVEDELSKRTDTLARVQADYENYRKRVDKEKQQAREEAHAELVEVLVGVLDDVERALSADPDENVRKGLELVVQRIEDKLETLDVEQVAPAVGEAFDPNRHEAMMTETTDEQEPDTVIEVLQPGYEMRDRLVRPARVKVAKAPASEATA